MSYPMMDLLMKAPRLVVVAEVVEGLRLMKVEGLSALTLTGPPRKVPRKSPKVACLSAVVVVVVLLPHRVLTLS